MVREAGVEAEKSEKGAQVRDFAKNNNPTYHRFIELAIEKSRAGAYSVKREAAIAYVQTVIRMVREEYAVGGEEQLRKLLNIDGKRKDITRRRHDDF